MALPGDINSRLHRCITTDGSGNPALRFVSAGFAANSVNDTHIDWGVGADQVSAIDMPIADLGGYFTGTEVETALQELGAATAAGEANTASNVGTAGTGIFKQKDGVDLEFYKLNSASNKLTIALSGTDKIDFTVNEGNIDHDALTNFAAGEHRIINDAGTSATELWSASKINSELSGKAASSHTHAAGDITSGTFADVLVAESNVTQHEGAIDHDALTNFAADEHIDWKVTGAEDIHDDRIAQSSVTQHEGAIDHDALTNFASNEHYTQASITAVGTVASGNVDAAVSAATTSAAGKIEIGTTAETNTGTASLAMAPDQFKASDWGFRYLMLKSDSSADDATVADGVFGIPIPEEFDTWDVLDVIGIAHTAGATNTTDIQVRRRRSGAEVDVLTTPVTLAGQTYANDGSINGANDDLATGDILYGDVDAVETTPPKGLIILVKIGLT